jgi:hypothetical protein
MKQTSVEATADAYLGPAAGFRSRRGDHSGPRATGPGAEAGVGQIVEQAVDTLVVRVYDAGTATTEEEDADGV